MFVTDRILKLGKYFVLCREVDQKKFDKYNTT